MRPGIKEPGIKKSEAKEPGISQPDVKEPDVKEQEVKEPEVKEPIVPETLEDFAAEVSSSGPVCVVGGATRFDLGGPVDPDARRIRAPAGIVDFQPAEMTVRVGAGTPVAELHARLAEAGQETALPQRSRASVGPEGNVGHGASVGPKGNLGHGASVGLEGSVGGALAVGESAITRLGRGPVRDALLQARYVSADGELVTAGAATVKNVSGFDLCRLLVGSLGTIGCLGEVLLRTRPCAQVERWVSAEGVDPRAVLSLSRTADSILWNGKAVWVLLAGWPVDVRADLGALGDLGAFVEAEPPQLPPHRWSCTPAQAADFASFALASFAAAGNDPAATAGDFVAEIGVGVVHARLPQPERPLPSAVVALNQRIKDMFDPAGRLNPPRRPW